MADTVFDSISQVNTEAVPRALEAALKLDENISEIGSRTQSYKRDSTILIEQFQRNLEEKLLTSEMTIENTERKLQVLMKRLQTDLDHRSGHVAEETSDRMKAATSFIEDTAGIDQSTSVFGSVIEKFESEVDDVSNQINSAADAYSTMSNEMDEQINSAFQTYEQLHGEAKNLIANTLSEGTDTIMNKMSGLESLIGSTLSDYGQEANEVVDFLRGQTEEGTDAFDTVLSLAEDTLGGVTEIFDGSVGDISDKLEEIANLIEAIKPVLDFIDELI